MQLVSLKEMPLDVRINVLRQLGYSIDEHNFVIDASGNPVIDKYIDKKVDISNMLILPGSTVILDDNPLSLTAYLEEYDIDAI